MLAICLPPRKLEYIVIVILYLSLFLQESEIAEVLYKQDVDLGFSLDQEQIINASYASGNSAAKNREKDSSPDAEKGEKKAKSDDDNDKHASNKDNANDNDDDDIEKLKALEELREDKVRYTTGEIYIGISQL